MSKELKPCPFCGSESVIDADYGQEYWCECRSCKCRTGTFWSRHLADQRWNTRALLAQSESTGGEIVSGVKRYALDIDCIYQCEGGEYVLASDYDRLEREGDGLAGNLRTALLDRAAAESERDQLRAELSTLKAGQGEAVAIAECREVHGHMCQFLNRTQHGMDTLRDGDKLYTAPPATADARLVPVELLELCIEGFDDYWVASPEGIECTSELRALLAQSNGVKP